MFRFTRFFLLVGLIDVVWSLGSRAEDTKVQSLADILQILMDRHPGLEIRVEFDDDVRQQATTFSSTLKPTSTQSVIPIDKTNGASLTIMTKLEDVLKRLDKLDSFINTRLQRQKAPIVQPPPFNQTESSGEEEVSQLLSGV